MFFRFTRAFLLAAAAFSFTAKAVDAPALQKLGQEFCFKCHGEQKQKGDFNFEPYAAKPDVLHDRKAWEKIAEQLESREMPPEGKPQPTDAQRAELVAWVDAQLDQGAAMQRNPGRVTIRRLNNEEYKNTIRDLLAVDFDPSDFPQDETAFGFNTIAEALTLPPLLMEKYLNAADQIASRAFGPQSGQNVKRYVGAKFKSTTPEWVNPQSDGVMGFYREGEATDDVVLREDGDYTLRILAYGEQAGDEPPRLAVKLDGHELGVLDVKATSRPKPYELHVSGKAGTHKLSLAYLNNYNGNDSPNPKLRGDRNVFVAAAELDGPLVGGADRAVAKMEAASFKLDGTTAAVNDGALTLFSSPAEAVAMFTVPAKSEYLLRVPTWGDQAGNELPKLKITLDGAELGVFEIKAKEGEPAQILEKKIVLEAGGHKVGVAFLNDFFDPATKADRNAFVAPVEVFTIRTAEQNAPESYRRFFTKLPQPGEESRTARELLAPFASRAFRRPATAQEMERLGKLVDASLADKATFTEACSVAVQAVLCSPTFLFRWELDPATSSGDVRDLTDYEVAARLSYFLWSSLPDGELTALAEKGQLLKDGNVQKQSARMLKDWRSYAFMRNFSSQWLQLRAIDEIEIDRGKFPKFNDQLREAMKDETEMFFGTLVQEDRSIFELIESDFTFVNDKLAALYDLPPVQGDKLQRVQLPPGSPRSGVLGKAAVLLATSMPTRTSPVVRGKWVLEQILGTPPPPPPANVPPLEEAKVDKNASLRVRLEQHRSNPDCAVCHAKIDPVGFALENFDSIGAWRTQDGVNPVDASGTLPNGNKVNGVADLRKYVKSEKFARSFVQKMMIYALGRGLERYDKPSIDAVFAQTTAGGSKMSALINAIITSDPFLKRKRTLAAR